MNSRRLDPDIPDPVESRRSASGRTVRVAYGTGVIALALFLMWHFGQQFIFLEGPGKITAKMEFISARSFSKILSVNVVPGARVAKGELIGIRDSLQIEQYITDLQKLIIDQNNKEAEYRIRLAVAKATSEYSQKRLDVATDAVARLESGPSQAAGALYRTEVYRERANANLIVAQSNAEVDEVSKQLNKLLANTALIERNLKDVRHDYDDGRLVAPVSGIIGPQLAKAGEVIAPGGVIAEIYDSDDIHIEWQIPSSRWIEPRVGDAVFIFTGGKSLTGHIQQIYPLSADFTATAKSAIQEIPHGQIARVSNKGFAKNTPFNSYVTVRMNYSGIVDVLSRFYCKVVGCD